jgi:hypothetical protein
MSHASQYPSLTIAIIELVGGEAMECCINALHAQIADMPVDIVRIDRSGNVLPDTLAANDENMPAGSAAVTVPQRRMAAVRAAQTDLVALIEDTTLPPANWATLLREAFADKRVAACWGPIEISGDLSARYRSLGFMEYGRYDGTLSITATLHGNCMAVDRLALLDVLEVDEDGIAEQDIAHRLSEGGKGIVFLPEMVANYAAPDAYGASLTTRLMHGRLYASARYDGASMITKAMGALRAMLAPIMLVLRGTNHMVRKSRLINWPAEFIWLCLMSMAAGMGELAGTLFGPGTSAESWR